MKIIYIHHYYSKPLFYKIAHNTTDREFYIDESGVGYITAKYKNINIKFIFNPIINYNDDGIHLVDFYAAYDQRFKDSTYTPLIERNTLLDTAFLKKVSELIKDEKNWIISIFRMEKIIGKYDDINVTYMGDIEDELDNLKNHYIISDNVIFNSVVKYKYSNHFFCLTNTIHQWNEYISIRWHYEYKNIFEKLNQPYDLGFSMRHHKKHRIKIINGLAKLNDNRLFLSRVDNSKGKEHILFKDLIEKNNIHCNITKGTDFEDINWLQNVGEYQYLDYLMRVLPMAKMHILSETWDYKNGDYTSSFLSEKTYGFLLAKIPFISTHIYPLEMIQFILNVPKYPFYNEIKSNGANPEKFVAFVKWFMEDFDTNYKLCKEWVNVVHGELMKKMNNENSLLELILDEFPSKEKTTKFKKNLL